MESLGKGDGRVVMTRRGVTSTDEGIGGEITLLLSEE